MANPFDQFDAPQGSGNPFDQFDGQSGAMPHIGALTTNGALSALQGARADLERQIAHMTPQQQAMARQTFEANPQIQAIKAKVAPVTAPNGATMTLGNSLARGLTVGLSDKIGAAITAPIAWAIDHSGSGPRSNLSLGDEYQQSRDWALAQGQADQQAHPIASTVGNVGGAIGLGLMTGGAGEAAIPAAAVPANAFARAGSLALKGGIAGAGYGAVNAAGQSNADTWGGLYNDAEQGAKWGAATGAVLAPVADIGARGLGRTWQAIRNFGNPGEGYGAELVAQKLAQDNVSPAEAAQWMQEGTALGAQPMLADIGHNTRAFAGSVSRQQGAARDIALNAIDDRQLGMGDRVKEGISNYLGVPVDTYAESQRLMQQAKTAADPLYTAFRAEPSRTSAALEEAVNTPVGRTAMANARTIALNDRVDPNSLGFELDNEGNIQLVKNPSPQTLDYVKQGLDDALEAYRDNTTGRLNLDRMGRSIEGVRSDYVNEMDRLYPNTYPQARQAYAGPAAMNNALQDGKRAFAGNKSSNEILQRWQNLTPPEQDQYALGYRSAMADAVDSKGDMADRASALIGSQKKRDALQEVFGGAANLSGFTDYLRHEQAGATTYRKIAGNSASADRLAEDAQNGDAQLLAGLGKAASYATAGKAGLVKAGITGIQNAFATGVGKAGQRAREDASALLFSSSPNDFIQGLSNAQARIGQRAAQSQARGLTAARTVLPLAGQAGRLAIQRSQQAP